MNICQDNYFIFEKKFNKNFNNEERDEIFVALKIPIYQGFQEYLLKDVTHLTFLLIFYFLLKD